MSTPRLEKQVSFTENFTEIEICEKIAIIFLKKNFIHIFRQVAQYRKKIKMTIYARKPLLFLQNFERGSLGLKKKQEMSHSAGKIAKEDALVPLYFCKHTFFESARDSNPIRPIFRPREIRISH